MRIEGALGDWRIRDYNMSRRVLSCHLFNNIRLETLQNFGNQEYSST